MGILSGLIGNVSVIEVEKIEKELEMILTEGEQVQEAFRLIRDLIVFTDKRLVLIDKQGVTGKKTAYHSIPYKSISHFSMETAGHFDLEAEFKIWLSGHLEPIVREFKRDKNIFDVQRTLAKFVTK